MMDRYCQQEARGHTVNREAATCFHIQDLMPVGVSVTPDMADRPFSTQDRGPLSKGRRLPARLSRALQGCLLDQPQGQEGTRISQDSKKYIKELVWRVAHLPPSLPSS